MHSPGGCAIELQLIGTSISAMAIAARSKLIVLNAARASRNRVMIEEGLVGLALMARTIELRHVIFVVDLA